jgi:hypothetical protein
VDKDTRVDQVFDIAAQAIMLINQVVVEELAVLEKKIWMQTLKDKLLTAVLV